MSLSFNLAHGAGARPLGLARDVAGALAHLSIHAVHRLVAYRRRRRARLEMTALADHLLDDIGVTRAQLERML